MPSLLEVSKAVPCGPGCIRLIGVANGTSRKQGAPRPPVANGGFSACRCQGEMVPAYRLGAVQRSISPNTLAYIQYPSLGALT